MGRIFKHDWANGKQVRKWYGEYRDLQGKKRKVALCSDRRASEQALNSLQ